MHRATSTSLSLLSHCSTASRASNYAIVPVIITVPRFISSSFSSSPSSSRSVPSCTSSSSSFRSFSTAPAATPIPASLVKQLRDLTSAPMMECKNALVAEKGDIQNAVEWLRKKGIASATKKAGRTAEQGLVCVALHQKKGDGSSSSSAAAAPATEGSIVEVNCETDFVARNEIFQSFSARVAQAALSSLAPVSGACGDGGHLVTTTQSAATLGALVLPGGDAVSGAACNVKEGVTSMVAKIGENVILRRGAKLVAPAGGTVCAYTHNAVAPGAGGSIGVLVALSSSSSSSDATATTVLQDIGKKVAMHVAAAKPLYLSRESIPADEYAKEKTAAEESVKALGKPAHIASKIAEGKLGKWVSETCLLEQSYVLSEDGVKVKKFIEESGKAGGLKGVNVTGFLLFKLGDKSEATAAVCRG